MKTLEQHNEQRRWYHEQDFRENPIKNGIECPVCRTELWDSNPCMTLTSDPPQKNVHCDECGYRGYRVA